MHSHTNDRLDGQIPKNLIKKQPNQQTATNTPTTQHYNKPTTYCVPALNLEYINGNGSLAKTCLAINKIKELKEQGNMEIDC